MFELFFTSLPALGVPASTMGLVVLAPVLFLAAVCLGVAIAAR